MDNWVIVEISDKDGSVAGYKVLMGTSGGYTDGDSWRMNSGIKDWTEESNNYIFSGYSGSSYTCPKNREGVRMNIAGVIEQITKTGLARVIDMEEFIKNYGKNYD